MRFRSNHQAPQQLMLVQFNCGSMIGCSLQWYGYNRFVRWLVEAPLGSAPDRIAMFIVITNVIGTTIYDCTTIYRYSDPFPATQLKSISNSLTIIYSNLLSSAKVLGFPTCFSVHYFLKSHTS